MQKKVKRRTVMFVHIQDINHKWIKKQMRHLGYSRLQGKSEFVDDLLSSLRNKKSLKRAC